MWNRRVIHPTQWNNPGDCTGARVPDVKSRPMRRGAAWGAQPTLRTFRVEVQEFSVIPGRGPGEQLAQSPLENLVR